MSHCQSQYSLPKYWRFGILIKMPTSSNTKNCAGTPETQRKQMHRPYGCGGTDAQRSLGPKRPVECDGEDRVPGSPLTGGGCLPPVAGLGSGLWAQWPAPAGLTAVSIGPLLVGWRRPALPIPPFVNQEARSPPNSISFIWTNLTDQLILSPNPFLG